DAEVRPSKRLNHRGTEAQRKHKRMNEGFLNSFSSPTQNYFPLCLCASVVMSLLFLFARINANTSSLPSLARHVPQSVVERVAHRARFAAHAVSPLAVPDGIRLRPDALPDVFLRFLPFG